MHQTIVAENQLIIVDKSVYDRVSPKKICGFIHMRFCGLF